ncbi:MAG: hypothetical protein ABI321_13185 [Polyangia bacterium]
MMKTKALALLFFLGGVVHGVAHADHTDPDQALLSGPKCKAFSEAVQREAGSVTPTPGTSPEKLVANMLAGVKASIPAVEWKTCSAAFQRGMDAYRSKSIEAEAQVVLRQVASGLSSHLVDSGKLCPSTKHPTPAKLELVSRDVYTPTAADWADPAWTCAAMQPDLRKQHFQYELKTTSTSAEIIARGYPTPGRLVTFTRTGKVEGAGIKWGDVVRK